MRFLKSLGKKKKFIFITGGSLVAFLLFYSILIGIDDSADLVLLNGRIYTVTQKSPWIEAVAVRDGRIWSLGNTNEIKETIGWRTEVIDLEEKMVMPGLHDAHVHFFLGAIETKVNCRLEPDSTMDEIISTLNKCKNENRTNNGWIIGGPYNPTMFPDNQPNNEALNRQFPDTPVYLSDYSAHNALANHRALELMGIDETVKDPEVGHFGRDPKTGKLTGLLVERARTITFKKLPQPSYRKLFTALNSTIKEMNQHGITSIQEALAVGPIVKLLNAMDTIGLVTLAMDVHWMQRMPDMGIGGPLEQEKWIRDRHDYESENIYVNNVKYFLDGAPLPPKPTDSRLDPITGEPDQRMLLIKEDELTELFIRMDRNCIKIKAHAVGDGAARVMMNAMDRMRETNGDSGIFHDIAHGQSVLYTDGKRPAKNNTVIEFSPSFWNEKKTGEGAIIFKFRSAVESGALVTAGTDWPVVPDTNLFPAIAGMIDYGDESVDLKTAIEIFTINGARSIRREKTEGSIEKGKWANLIILDRNIFKSSPDEISGTKVERTLFKGKTVYCSGN